MNVKNHWKKIYVKNAVDNIILTFEDETLNHATTTNSGSSSKCSYY